eukprot:1757701-Rhodomonas_salina.4
MTSTNLLAGALVGHERADKEDALRETVAPEQRDLSVALQRALVQASREHVVAAPNQTPEQTISAFPQTTEPTVSVFLGQVCLLGSG